MFALQHDNPPSLRQGDILSNMFFPLARPAMVRHLGTYRSGSGTDINLDPFVDTPKGSIKQYLQSLAHGVIAHGAVLSQCCDLDKKHPRTSFSLCRLILFEPTRYRNVEALIGNIDPYGTVNPHFQFFYFGQVHGLTGEYLSDFGLLTSLPWADYDLALNQKVCQLDDLNRNKFRVKAGAFFGRPMDEDVAKGMANPWQQETPTLAPSWWQRIRGKT